MISFDSGTWFVFWLYNPVKYYFRVVLLFAVFHINSIVSIFIS